MLLTGMISYVFESVECEGKRTLGTVGRLFRVTDHFQDTLKSMRDKLGSIRSTLTTHLKPWQNPSIEALTQSGNNAIQIDNLVALPDGSQPNHAPR